MGSLSGLQVVPSNKWNIFLNHNLVHYVCDTSCNKIEVKIYVVIWCQLLQKKTFGDADECKCNKVIFPTDGSTALLEVSM